MKNKAVKIVLGIIGTVAALGFGMHFWHVYHPKPKDDKKEEKK